MHSPDFDANDLNPFPTRHASHSDIAMDGGATTIDELDQAHAAALRGDAAAQQKVLATPFHVLAGLV